MKAMVWFVLSSLICLGFVGCNDHKPPAAARAKRKTASVSKWSCNAILEKSTCTEWVSLSAGDVPLKRDNVCHVLSKAPEFARKLCPREKLVGTCASLIGETHYYYYVGGKPFNTKSARKELCDQMNDLDPGIKWADGAVDD
jgi:hypothetical protein